MLRATSAYTFSTSQLPKVLRSWCGLRILISKCASRHNVCTFLTSQLPKVFRTWCAWCILTALVRRLNFQKCSEREVFLPFSLADVLRATTACNFLSLIWLDGSAPALASLRFDPPEPQMWRLSYLFAHLHLLSSHSFSALIFCSSPL